MKPQQCFLCFKMSEYCSSLPATSHPQRHPAYMDIIQHAIKLQKRHVNGQRESEKEVLVWPMYFSHTLISTFIFYAFHLSNTKLHHPSPSRYLAVYPGGAKLCLRPRVPTPEDQGQRGRDSELHEVLGQPNV